MLEKIHFIKDTYYRARGSRSKMIALYCMKRACSSSPFALYQKDDYPGLLKRLYLDRIIAPKISSDSDLICKNCGSTLGIRYIYAKEKRIAFKLFAYEVKGKPLTLKAAHQLTLALQTI
jgi:hypothetical protein